MSFPIPIPKRTTRREPDFFELNNSFFQSATPNRMGDHTFCVHNVRDVALFQANGSVCTHIFRKIEEFGEAFHQVDEELLNRIVFKVVAALSDRTLAGERVDCIPLTEKNIHIYYRHDRHSAYIYFNVKTGDYFHVAKVVWHKPSRLQCDGTVAKTKKIGPIVTKLYSRREDSLEGISAFHNPIMEKLNENDQAAIANIASICDSIFTTKLLQDYTVYYFTQPHFDSIPLGKAIYQYPQKISSFFYKALQAVEWLHSKEIVHGNISWRSIIITQDDRVVLQDSDSTSLATSPTWSKKLYKTPELSAPELLDQTAKDYRATDVWAWGCLAYQIGHGASPPYLALIPQNVEKALELQIRTTRSITKAREQLTNGSTINSLMAQLSVFALQHLPISRYPSAQLVEVMKNALKLQEIDCLLERLQITSH